ncbi:MAG: hypothetical protein AB1921_11940 [Thermodesulfobacteriota bacterium]
MKPALFSGALGLLALVCLALLAAAAPAAAEDGAPSASFTVDVLSAYIWRGQELSRDSAVIQPSATVGYKGFSANIWSNLDTDPYDPTPGADTQSALNETDLTLSYETALGPVTLGGGYIYYGLEAIPDTQEIYLSVGADVLLAPTFTAYRDIDHCPSWYFALGISHSFSLAENVGLDLSATASYLLSDSADDYPKIDKAGAVLNEKFSAFHDGKLAASLPIAFGKFSVSPNIAYVFPLTDDARNEMKWRSKTGNDDNFVVGGVTLGVSF